MPAETIDLSLRRIRDCAALASILKCADAAERRWLGRQIANLLAVLPAAQAELAAYATRAKLPELQELVRQTGMLETVVLELAQTSAAAELCPAALAPDRLEAESRHRLLKPSKI
jgi:hypothetical protein